MVGRYKLGENKYVWGSAPLRDRLQIKAKLTIWLAKDYITKNLIGGDEKLSKSKPLETQDGREAVGKTFSFF